MTGRHGFSLSSRVVMINGLIFALGTLLLTLSPATVSARPLLSEMVLLAVGLGLMMCANALLVRNTLRPLERLATALDHGRVTDPIERVHVPRAGIARRMATSVNDLIARIEQGQREQQLATLTAQEAEAARIARELHDGVGQSLTAVLLEVSALADGPGPVAPEALDDVREGTRTCLEEVRAVARQLRPHALEDLGLRSAVVALAARLFEHTPVHVTRTIEPGLPELSEAVELVVYRVAQEALTNVARHASASAVELVLEQGDGGVWLRVRDDGVGIPAGAGGVGLRGMRERAALVGGRLAVTPVPGRGTEVALWVPAGGAAR